MALSERDRAILDFERDWALEEGSKETAIRHRLDLSQTRYRELLNDLVDSADALEYDPMVVRRLRKSRERRRQARFERRSAGEPPVR
jgi:hypothetical protein